MSIIIDTDSYKLGHHSLYPNNMTWPYTYFSFRKPFDPNDNRMVFFGMRWLIEKYFTKPVTQEDFDEAEDYFAHHNLGGTQYPWPKEDWQKIVNDGGYLPLTIHSLADGQTVLPNIPCFTVTSKYKWLPGWVETFMTRIWSPSTTATKAKFIKQDIKKYFEQSVDSELYFLLDSRLHDFGS